MSTLVSILKDQAAAWEASQAKLTTDELLAARDWIKDCLGTFRDLEDEQQVDELSDAEITRGIARNFDGGLGAFKASVQS